MRDNFGFILTFSAMMLCVALAGCEQMGVKNQQNKSWNIEMNAKPDGSCELSLHVEGRDEHVDNTININDPMGG